MSKPYQFDRYVDGRLMAQGAYVYADSESDALKKAEALFEPDAAPGEMEQTQFILRKWCRNISDITGALEQ